ncbi:Fic family protein [Paracoccus indicus]|uniref:Fic family protein n=1 Tax=Paracoccus indicus TaxID=2079229 RepID=UPI000D3BF41B|nr:Fic family protein [Paracoccus indicus]
MGVIRAFANHALAQKAVVHIRVQEWIESQPAAGNFPEPFFLDTLRETHRRLYSEMPEIFRQINNVEQLVPFSRGAFRSAGQEVVVGRHRPPSSIHLDKFMGYFEMRYCGLTRGVIGRILSIPAAHHRFSYIYPFLDGNGGVSR